MKLNIKDERPARKFVFEPGDVYWGHELIGGENVLVFVDYNDEALVAIMYEDGKVVTGEWEMLNDDCDVVLHENVTSKMILEAVICR